MTAANPSMIRKFVDSVYVLWAILAAPGIYLLVQKIVFHGKLPYVPFTGELSCWLLIVTMAITPLMLLLGPMPWLKARRRYLGVASFGYASLHLLFWLVNANIGTLIRSFTRIDLLPGWIAMALFVAMAVTSNDMSVRKLGPRWKSLQRWVYAAAILTLLHWVLTSDNLTEVAIYTLPLIALSIWRVLRYRSGMRRI